MVEEAEGRVCLLLDVLELDLDGLLFFVAGVDLDEEIVFLEADLVELDGGNVSGTAFLFVSVVGLGRSLVSGVGGLECGGE